MIVYMFISVCVCVRACVRVCVCVCVCVCAKKIVITQSKVVREGRSALVCSLVHYFIS